MNKCSNSQNVCFGNGGASYILIPFTLFDVNRWVRSLFVVFMLHAPQARTSFPLNLLRNCSAGCPQSFLEGKLAKTLAKKRRRTEVWNLLAYQEFGGLNVENFNFSIFVGIHVKRSKENLGRDTDRLKPNIFMSQCHFQKWTQIRQPFILMRLATDDTINDVTECIPAIYMFLID